MDLGAFEVGLKVIEGACGAVPSFFIFPGKKKFVIAGTNQGAQATFNIPGTLEGLTGPIEIQKDVFVSAIKGRKEAEVSIVDGELTIKSGKYQQVIHVTDARETIEIGEPSEGESFDMTPDLHAYLVKTLPSLRIERPHSALPDVMVHFRFTEKQAFTVAYDSMQMCFIGSPNKTGAVLSVALPYTRFASFIKDLPVANAKIVVTTDALFAFTKTFTIQIPIPSMDENSSTSPDAVYEKAKEIAKLSSGNGTVSLPKPDLELFLENSKSLVAVGTEVQFVPGKKGTTVLVDSPKGKATLKFSEGTTATEKFGLDYRFVQALLQKSSESLLSFFVVDSTFVVSKANVVYVALLSASSD